MRRRDERLIGPRFGGVSFVQWATEIKVRAERRAGEMLKQSAERGERATHKDGASSRTMQPDRPQTLADMGITKDQSSRWQQVASIPIASLRGGRGCARGGFAGGSNGGILPTVYRPSLTIVIGKNG